MKRRLAGRNVRSVTAAGVLVLMLAAIPRSAAAADSKPICLLEDDIVSTEIPNDSTILFHMRDHSVYKSALTVPCVGLRNTDEGISYEPTDPGTRQLCDYLGMFRLNNGFGHGSGRVCNFGPFSRVS